MKINVNTDEILRAVERDDMVGFCVTCGAEHECVEPDAREYHCDDCETPTVYGAEELLAYVA